MCPLDRVRVLEARVAALEEHTIPGLYDELMAEIADAVPEQVRMALEAGGPAPAQAAYPEDISPAEHARRWTHASYVKKNKQMPRSDPKQAAPPAQQPLTVAEQETLYLEGRLPAQQPRSCETCERDGDCGCGVSEPCIPPTYIHWQPRQGEGVR